MKRYRNKGFTLVEVLICVGIIGIIAAITIPALLTSTSEKALEAQRKALYSRMAQAFGQIKNLKAYERSTTEDLGSAVRFITLGLQKTYKLTNVCEKDELAECGVPNTIYDYYSDSTPDVFTTLDKPNLTDLNEKINPNDLGPYPIDFAGFKTANGESVLLWYNPKCVSKSEASQTSFVRSVCVNMVYDLNGPKAPNAYGEDIGYITVFYPTDSQVVTPVLYHTLDGIFTGTTYQGMLEKSSEMGLVPPTIEELISILINKNLTHITKNIDATKLYWSSSYTSDGTNEVWTAGLDLGIQKQTATGVGSTTHEYFLLKK